MIAAALSTCPHCPQPGISALQDISVDIEHKQFVTVVGPSGCGKSAIMKMADRALSSKATNAEPKAFRWTKSADDILAGINRFRLRTIGGNAIEWSGLRNRDTGEDAHARFRSRVCGRLRDARRRVGARREPIIVP